jgi:hypothetical protein
MEASTTWIRKHIEHVVFRLRGIKTLFVGIRRAKGFFRIPASLPLGFKFIEGKRFACFRHKSGDWAEKLRHRQKDEKKNPVWRFFGLCSQRIPSP